MVDNRLNCRRAALLRNQRTDYSANILVPQAYLGGVITLCIEKRGVQKDMQYVGRQVSLHYELPLSEVCWIFWSLKSVSRVCSLIMNFAFSGSGLVKLDVLIIPKKLTLVDHCTPWFKQYRGHDLVEKMKDLIHGKCTKLRYKRIGSKISPDLPLKHCEKCDR